MADEAVSAKLHAYVVTPFKIFFDDECEMVVFSTSDGEMGIMADHSPLVTELIPGELRIKKDGEWLYAYNSNGYVQVEKKYIMLVCTSAEWSEAIDPDRAKEALARAEERMAEEGLSSVKKRYARHAVRRAKKRLMVHDRHIKRDNSDNSMKWQKSDEDDN